MIDLDRWLKQLRLEPLRRRMLNALVEAHPKAVMDSEFAKLARSGYMAQATVKVHISEIRLAIRNKFGEHPPFEIARLKGRGYYIVSRGSVLATRTTSSQHP